MSGSAARKAPRVRLGGGAADQLLPAGGAIGVKVAGLIAEGRVAVNAGFKLTATEANLPLCAVAADGQHFQMDALNILTGLRPDLSILNELCLSLDPAPDCTPALAPVIDPILHSRGTVHPHGAVELAHAKPGLYIAGMQSHGRAPTFLLASGHEQVRSIVAAIAGDHVAAARVELVLPETGVCNGPGRKRAAAASGGCGGPALHGVVACCIADAVAKDDGRAGCGCNASQPEQKAAACC